jgi:hypothetical protein
LRDAVFSSQRYWESHSYIVNGLPQMIDAQHLPIILPEVENIYQQKTITAFRNAWFGLGIQQRIKW